MVEQMWQQQHMCNVRLSITDASSSWQDKWLSEWRIDAASPFISLPLLSFSLSLSLLSLVFFPFSFSCFLFSPSLPTCLHLSSIFFSLHFFTFFFLSSPPLLYFPNTSSPTHHLLSDAFSLSSFFYLLPHLRSDSIRTPSFLLGSVYYRTLRLSSTRCQTLPDSLDSPRYYSAREA